MKKMIIFMAGLLLISFNVFAGPDTGTLGTDTPTPSPTPSPTEVNHNTAYGDNALSSNTTGNHNTAIGELSLYRNTTANKNTAVGDSALMTQSFDNGGTSWDSHNTAVGFQALYLNQPTRTGDGYQNTAVGSLSLRSNTTGSYNTANGYWALNSNTTGNHNTAVGSGALQYNTTGVDNTAIGGQALYVNKTGRNNTAIGNGAGVSADGLNNATAIGHRAQVDASNKVVIGNTFVTSIGGYSSWSNFSDQRVKTDIEDIGYGLDLIRQLQPVSFRMINSNGKTDFGFIAQDIEALLGDGYNVLDIGGGEERMLSLRYSQFIAPMVKAMQEQQAMIDSQQEQIDELKKIVAELSKRF